MRICSSAVAKAAFNVLLLGLVGCVEGGDSGAEITTTTQQLRAGQGDEGQSFLGIDVLATNRTQKVMGCEDGELKVEVAYSISGETGPFTAVEEEEVSIRCGLETAGDFALVVDNSGSEEGFLAELKHSARDVIHRLLPLGGRASLVRVSTEASVISEVTADRSDLEHGLNGMRVSNGWTALYDGIRMGNETLGRAAMAAHTNVFSERNAFCATSQKLGIVAITDGGENNSAGQRLADDSYPGDGVHTTLDDLKQLRVAGVTTPIYTIGLGDDVDHTGLEALALHTGGRHMRIDTKTDIAEAFGVIADYAEGHHQVCATLPDDVCGVVHVRVGHAFEYIQGKRRRTTSGERVYRMHLDCPDVLSSPEQAASGRVLTALVAISDLQMSGDARAELVANMVNRVTDVSAPAVLIVEDDWQPHNEHHGDTAYVRGTLESAGFNVAMMNEPQDGLEASHVHGFDVVWFANPGDAIDDMQTVRTLEAFAHFGGGVVMQGDDMGACFGQAFSMENLTGLEYVGGGASYCGRYMNNGQRDYSVDWENDLSSPMTTVGTTMYYADDIDTVRLTAEDTQVLAWASAAHASACEPKPAFILLDHKH